MIACLRGNVISVSENCVILEVSGVGYQVICSQRVIDAATTSPHNLFLHTELIIRENAWTLFGFYSEQERDMFNMLTSVSGVGGRIAIAILSSLNENELYNAILNEDRPALCRAQGVGDRMAVKIIADLKTKVAKMYGKQKISINATGATSIVLDVKSALVNLGYPATDIAVVLSSPDLQGVDDFNVLLKLALQKISGMTK